jgi:hypothetical protein
MMGSMDTITLRRPDDCCAVSRSPPAPCAGWRRHSLFFKHGLLLRPEKPTAERQLTPADEQIKLLERFSPGCRERQIEAPHTSVDTFFVGVLKGGDKAHLQIAIDCHSRHPWARLYRTPIARTANV